MDKDLENKSLQDLQEEVMKLRNAIRNHRDSSGHDLCWYVPELWNLLPESQSSPVSVPESCEFVENCIKYRQSLGPELSEILKTAFNDPEVKIKIAERNKNYGLEKFKQGLLQRKNNECKK